MSCPFPPESTDQSHFSPQANPLKFNNCTPTGSTPFYPMLGMRGIQPLPLPLRGMKASEKYNACPERVKILVGDITGSLRQM